MTEKEQAIELLDSLTPGDPEVAHSTADDILLMFLKESGHGGVAKAWERANERIGFWYA